MPFESLAHPLAVAMWDFSWLERRWPGAGYDDWAGALDGMAERGYDCVPIDPYPHLLAEATVPFRVNTGTGPDLLAGRPRSQSAALNARLKCDRLLGRREPISIPTAGGSPPGRGGGSHRPDPAGRDPRKRSAVGRLAVEIIVIRPHRGRRSRILRM